MSINKKNLFRLGLDASLILTKCNITHKVFSPFYPPATLSLANDHWWEEGWRLRGVREERRRSTRAGRRRRKRQNRGKRRRMWATHPKLSINVNALLVIQQNLERKSQFEKKLLLISIISHLPLRYVARWLHYHYHYSYYVHYYHPKILLSLSI